MSYSNTLPSQFQINDEVLVRGIVSQVHFAEDKVNYVVSLLDGESDFRIESDFIEARTTPIEERARRAHELNRAYCAATGDTSQLSWNEAPQWQRDSAIAGVTVALNGATPEQLHQSWMDQKVADGWVYGEVKNADAKTHPCLVPYDQLPTEQKIKDHLFRAAVAL